MDTRVQDAISVQAVCRQCASSVQAVCKQCASSVRAGCEQDERGCMHKQDHLQYPQDVSLTIHQSGDAVDRGDRDREYGSCRPWDPAAPLSAGFDASRDSTQAGIRRKPGFDASRDSTQAGIRRKPGFSASRDSARERDQGGLGSSGICGIEWGRDPCLTHVWSVQSDDPQTSQSVGRPRRRQC